MHFRRSGPCVGTTNGKSGTVTTLSSITYEAVLCIRYPESRQDTLCISEEEQPWRRCSGLWGVRPYRDRKGEHRESWYEMQVKR